MGSWPFARLHYGRDRCVAIAGPHIQIIDAISGTILHSQRCASNISCSTVDEAYTWLVTTGEDKLLYVWTFEGLKLQSSRELSKKATAVQLSRDAQTILVADKFGDVFSYPLVAPSDMPAQSKKRDAVASHVTPHGSLVLGHASIITALLLSHDGHYIITADRDEHIRVSHYPRGYIIERYCLGHRLFLSALCLPVFEPATLISGGGDAYLHLWDWMSGTLRCQIPVAEAVRPFLRVRESRTQWHHRNEGRRKGGARRGKKARKDSDEPGPSAARESPNGDALSGDGQKDDMDLDLSLSATDGDVVLALAKIEAVEFDEARVLVFSAFGASALFYCLYPSDPNGVPLVNHIEFAQPLLDFVVAQRGRVLVSLDKGWTGSSDMDGGDTAIILLEWKNGGFKISTEESPLADTLNGPASLEASSAELVTLELYAALSLLPKHADGGDEGAGEQDMDSHPGMPGPRSKVVGRQKTRQALLRRQELERDSGDSEEPEPKKIKLGDDVQI